MRNRRTALLMMLPLVALLLCQSIPAFATEPLTQEQIVEREAAINAGVAEICEKHQQIIRSESQINGGNTAQFDEFSKQVTRDCIAEMRRYLTSQGLVGSEYGEEIYYSESSEGCAAVLSLPSAITAYYDSYNDPMTGEIYYYCYWDWTDGAWDLSWDTFDLVSAQLRYDDGWRWRSMECQTWDRHGNETGFTDGNPWNTRGDAVSLRQDFWQGKVYNLHDEYNPVTYSLKTDTIRIAGWITPGTRADNQVRSDFEHNWKTIQLTSASISGVSLTEFTMNVQYSTVHYHWPVGTNARTIIK